MWKVVNDQGTAKQAQIEVAGYEMCGKTGSAQAIPRRISNKWTLEFEDGIRQETVEGLSITGDDILARYDDPRPKIVGRHTYERFPPLGVDGKLPSHAWFTGYTQATGTPRGATPRGRSLAISVIIEYGGSGGRVAGPCAKQIAESILSAKPPSDPTPAALSAAGG
jgi:cell division protein FtsI/penicillin-binding protein 2